MEHQTNGPVYLFAYLLCALSGWVMGLLCGWLFWHG